MSALARCFVSVPDLLGRLRRDLAQLGTGDRLPFAALTIGTVAMAAAVVVWLDRAAATFAG